MLIKEYRLTLPFTKEEYRLGQRYMTARKTHESSNSNGGGENVEILERSSYTDKDGNKGNYTHKVFLLNKSLPRYATALLPKSALSIEEKSWNCYPHTKTQYSCPFFGEKFYLCIESVHKDGKEEEENVFKLDKDMLKKRIVDHIDIARDQIDSKDYKVEEDPKCFKSKKTGRGPLTSLNWRKEVIPSMTVYKLVSVNFNYWGFQHKVENLVQTTGLREVFLKAHRSLFCWMDEWIDLSEEEIEQFESATYSTMMKPPSDCSGTTPKILKSSHTTTSDKPFKCPNDKCSHVCNECQHLMTTTTTTKQTITQTTTTIQSPICCPRNSDSINVMN